MLNIEQHTTMQLNSVMHMKLELYLILIFYKEEVKVQSYAQQW